MTAPLRSLLPLALLALPAGALAAACGGGAENIVEAEHQAGLRRLASDLLKATTEEQKPALVDGAITPEEYEAAILDTASCVGNEGIEVRNTRWQGTRRFTFDYGGSPTFEGSQLQGQAYKRCYEQFAKEIDFLWVSQLGPIPQSEIDLARESLRQCLVDRGQVVELEDLQLDSIAVRLGLAARFPDFGACAQATEEQFGFSPL